MPDSNYPMAEHGGYGGDTVQLSITRLLQTDIRYWRPALMELIKNRLMPETHQMLRFLISNMDSALEAYERGESLLRINYSLKPQNLDLVNWRRVLVGVNLVLLEPDTNFEIKNISVSFGRTTNRFSLVGMRTLLDSLLGLPWDVLMFVLSLNLSQASTLYETLTDVIQGYPIPRFCNAGIRMMYENEEMRPVLRKIGFYRRTAQESITWTQPEETRNIKALLNVLLGLYRTPSGIQAETVG